MIKAVELIVAVALMVFSFFAGVKYSDDVKRHASWLLESKSDEEVELPDLSSESDVEINIPNDASMNDQAAPATDHPAQQSGADVPMDYIDNSKPAAPAAQ